MNISQAVLPRVILEKMRVGPWLALLVIYLVKLIMFVSQ
jgi:hypothetical protein